ncbi:hypothetical protein QA601_09550 [Chitinispirillales bacterium ANBcel5]|uniref:hypothetical protein n=1 Tax=Cellulosispirillum alkaliphilum TaxID=3039283 RepID=UPI002A5863DD|nr:hypothetical protein [Chitinispirillales bacterium ANBcel5]
MQNLFENLETLLPIIIFIIWLIVTIIASSSKKRELPEEDEWHRKDTEPKEPKSSESTTSISEELKRSLEGIFGPLEEPKPKPEVKRKKEPEKRIKVQKKVEKDPYKKAKVPYLNKQKKFPTLEEGVYERETEPTQPLFTSKELRNAVVLSEILQLPIALREEIRESP